MHREKTSMTNAAYTRPTHVQMYVRSAAQSWFGRVATILAFHEVCRALVRLHQQW
jgi:hypothetical protein